MWLIVGEHEYIYIAREFFFYSDMILGVKQFFYASPKLLISITVA